MNRVTDDLISKAAAIDALKRAAYWQDAEHKIAELPVVDAAPVTHGVWIYFNGAGNGFYQCSECFHWIDARTDKNYCPNCGAKMETKNE